MRPSLLSWLADTPFFASQDAKMCHQMSPGSAASSASRQEDASCEDGASSNAMRTLPPAGSMTVTRFPTASWKRQARLVSDVRTLPIFKSHSNTLSSESPLPA